MRSHHHFGCVVLVVFLAAGCRYAPATKGDVEDLREEVLVGQKKMTKAIRNKFDVTDQQLEGIRQRAEKATTGVASLDGRVNIIETRVEGYIRRVQAEKADSDPSPQPPSQPQSPPAPPPKQESGGGVIFPVAVDTDPPAKSNPLSDPNRWGKGRPFISSDKTVFETVHDASTSPTEEYRYTGQPAKYRWVTRGKNRHLEAYVWALKKVAGYGFTWQKQWVRVFLSGNTIHLPSLQGYDRTVNGTDFPPPEEVEVNVVPPAIVVPPPPALIVPPVKLCPPSGGPALILPSGFVPPDPCSGTYGQPGGWKTWKYDTVGWPLRANSTGQYLDWQTRAHRAGR